MKLVIAIGVKGRTKKYSFTGTDESKVIEAARMKIEEVDMAAHGEPGDVTCHVDSVEIKASDKLDEYAKAYLQSLDEDISAA